MVEKVLDEEVRPMLTMHGGNVELLEITDNNVAKARLTGACGGCPMAQLTLLGIVENAVKSHIPEVKEVKAG